MDEDHFSIMSTIDPSDISIEPPSRMKVLVSTNGPLMKTEFIDSDCDDVYVVEFNGDDPILTNADVEEQDAFNNDMSAAIDDEYQSFAMTNLTAVTLPDGSQAFLASTNQNNEVLEMSDSEIAYVQAQILNEHDIDNTNISFLEVEGLNNEEPLAEDDAEEEIHGKKHACTFEGCERRYTTKHHLRVHERVHTGERPYVCTTCNRTFATSYSLKTHLRTHTGVRPFQCTQADCGKSFKTSGDLQKHIRTHTGERPFACTVSGCGRKFTTSNIMKVHMRTHTGERPYSCKYCDKKFSSTTNYRNHERIHTGVKPYVCPIESCGKRFTEYSSLYKHQVVHVPTRQYRCDICFRVFKQALSLDSHFLAAHSILNSDSIKNSSEGLDFLSAVETDDNSEDSRPMQNEFTDSMTTTGTQNAEETT